jgi:uncharacterized protein YndB with AHSA1/START domain
VNGLAQTKPTRRIDLGIDLGIDHGTDSGIDPGMIAMLPGQQERDVALSFQFNARSSRVFYALSIPEYIEAWLQAPDTEDLRFVFNQVAEETFRIDIYRGITLHSTVDGSCWVVGANQVRYLWKMTSLMDTRETVVDMKLLCSSGGCVLALKHSGLKDPAESARYRRMWQQSLERLSRLMA